MKRPNFHKSYKFLIHMQLYLYGIIGRYKFGGMCINLPIRQYKFFANISSYTVCSFLSILNCVDNFASVSNLYLEYMYIHHTEVTGATQRMNRHTE